jgi:predicted transcriptional regulator
MSEESAPVVGTITPSQEQPRPDEQANKSSNSATRQENQRTFIAGSEDDPKQGMARCLTCKGATIVKYQEALKIWTFVDGTSHTGHELELPAQDTVPIPSESHIPGLSPLLSYIIKQYQGMGLVGEERNIAQLFLSCITRHLPAKYRRHVIFQGDSGTGKTKIARTVLQPFWSDVENYTRVTGAGLDRRDVSLDGKILFLEQLEGSEPGQLKYLMTEGSLTILVADRDSSGRIVSRIHTVKGEPVVVSTLVGAVIDTQLLNRVSTLEIDESEQQTERITRYKLEQWSNVHKAQEDLLLRAIQQIDDKCWQLGQHVKEVNIPFATQLEKGLPKILSMRRGTDRILSLVAAIAFVKGALGMRPQVKLKGSDYTRGTYVIALPEDLTDALYCLGEAFSDSLTYFFGRSKQIYEELCKNSCASSRDIARVLKLSQNRAREYLNSLVELGYATKTKDKGVYRYEAKPHDNSTLKLEASYTELELQQWFQQQFTNNDAELVTPEESKTGFESPRPVQVCLDSEADSSTVQQIGQETVTDGVVVPKSGSEQGTNSTIPSETSLLKLSSDMKGR